MPAVLLKIDHRRAVLTLKSADGRIVDEEVWTFPPADTMPPERHVEAGETARKVFDDVYDHMSSCVHGRNRPE